MPAVSDALLSAIQALRAHLDEDVLGRVRAELQSLADAFDAVGNIGLSGEREWDEISTASAALTAQAMLRPAIIALATAGRIPPSLDGPRRVLVVLASECLVKALHVALPLSLVPNAQPVSAAAVASPESPIARDVPDLQTLTVLENIARHHREHERYYSVTLLEQAARLAREAAKLKVIADHWLDAPETRPLTAAVDFTEPAYRAAGCDDLNALRAIASIGILFMEGQGEPAEIAGLKSILGGSSAAALHSGKWLAGMMAAAWEREAALWVWAESAAAEARFRTIITNWIGAQQTVLVGRTLALARELLSKIDFAPAAIRKDCGGSGAAVLKVARVMGAAARLQGQCGVDLAGNDEPWTAYCAYLNRRRHACPT